MLRPACPGTGVIAGKVVRSVLDSAGVKDVLTKSLGSNNAANVAKATLAALTGLRRRVDIFADRGMGVSSPKSASRTFVHDKTAGVQEEAPEVDSSAEIAATDAPALANEETAPE